MGLPQVMDPGSWSETQADASNTPLEAQTDRRWHP